ncbi:MAG: phosphorylase, partial [Pseudomonadota bacterium]
MSRAGFVVALPDELKTLTKQRVSNGKCQQNKNGSLVALSGAGHDNAGHAAELLVERGATLLVSWGCAAALDRALTPGSLVLPEWIQNEEGIRYPTSVRWHRLLCDRLSEVMPVHTGPILACKRLISKSAAKSALADSTHSAALDMESAAIAEVARKHHVPFVAVRVIADPLDMSLPTAVERAINDDGEVVLFRLF